MSKEIVILELTCIKCGQIKPIPQKYSHRTNVCIQCRNEQQKGYNYQHRKYNKNPYTIEGVAGRQPYPLDPQWKHLNQRFRVMQRELLEIKYREDWRKLISQRLDDVLNNDRLYHWIIAHKSNQPVPKTCKQNEGFEEDL